ncbi:hypothetical protein SAMN05216428_11280 [Nitrosospira sp. Nsp11]|uniref:hypothetical protein n=1 Tax=Nitrosospira sp. Nsp11 TaxID=1855338 RepID=UPI00091EC1CA|nr:hypothetical protein [Nitrosospira sp. Nsp11]SHM05179.1 hypothetical protein SAMN05216428_11280 [Nitrosospira sp. Nsp11]
MDIQAIRRARLRRLIDERFNGKQTDLLAACNQNQGEISGLLSGKRVFGEKKARTLEDELHLGRGYFDRQSDKPVATLTEDQLKLLDLVERMDPKAREKWLALGESLPSVNTSSSVADTISAPSSELTKPERRMRPDKGPKARAQGYGMGETIRSGDLLPDDYFTEKRKKDGNSI